jgi:hypothetical protein
LRRSRSCSKAKRCARDCGIDAGALLALPDLQTIEQGGIKVRQRFGEEFAGARRATSMIKVNASSAKMLKRPT